MDRDSLAAVRCLARRATGNATDSDRQSVRTRVARSLGARIAGAWLLMSCIALGLASPQAAQAVMREGRDDAADARRDA